MTERSRYYVAAGGFGWDVWERTGPTIRERRPFARFFPSDYGGWVEAQHAAEKYAAKLNDEGTR